MYKILPNFVIPGVQKSGTFPLHEYLMQHPECVISNQKNQNFFLKLLIYPNLNYIKNIEVV